MWYHQEIRTLSDIPRHWATTTPDKVAIRAGTSNTTYAALEDDINQLASKLARAEHAQTVESRENVAFLGKNVPEFWSIWFAANRASRPFVPLNWRSALAELTEVVADAHPFFLFADREFAGVADELAAQHAGEMTVVIFDSTADGGRGLTSWDGPASRKASVVTSQPASDDIALITYTSGTTGRPKGVMVPHRAFDFGCLSDELEPSVTWSTDDVLLMTMPNFHLAGSWVSLPALYHGGTVAMVPSFEPSSFLDAVSRYRPTVTCIVPTAIQLLLSTQQTTDTDFTSLREIIYAGSPMPVPVIDQAMTTFGCGLRQFYGSTEAYIVTILRPEQHAVPGNDGAKASCGSPIPLVDVRVVDITGADVTDGTVGELVVRSPMLMTGYYRNPEETARVIRNGWYWTGDLGYRAPSGNYVLVDRAKDMVVTGGENVYSVEVERALQSHPLVAMVAVIGAPDATWGEAVTAYVVLAASDEVRADDDVASVLIEHCRSLIAAYKVPKALHVVSGLPLTPSGKVRKAELRGRVATNDPATV